MACPPLIWPQEVFWWASVVLEVIKLWPCLWSRVFHQVVSSFHLLGVLILQKSSKILLCVSLEEEPGPCPRLCYCFLAAPSLSPHPLSSLRNAGKVMEAGVCSTQMRKRGHRIGFCVQEHQSILLGFRTSMRWWSWASDLGQLNSWVSSNWTVIFWVQNCAWVSCDHLVSPLSWPEDLTPSALCLGVAWKQDWEFRVIQTPVSF